MLCRSVVLPALSRSAAAAFLFLLMSETVHAQGLGTIVGTVTDPSGGVVPNATVRIVEEGTSRNRETATDTRGYYVLPSLGLRRIR